MGGADHDGCGEAVDGTDKAVAMVGMTPAWSWRWQGWRLSGRGSGANGDVREEFTAAAAGTRGTGDGTGVIVEVARLALERPW